MRAGLISQFAASALLAPPVDAALYDKVIPTLQGDVVGYRAFNSSPAGNLTNWQAITVWKGIPFAADTSGENRWRQPQAAPKRNSTYYASDFGAVCPASAFGASTYTTSEDCLNLNIWSAANSSNAKLPVVMWSYPAGGTNQDALFTGGGMAAKDIVFVN